MMNLNDALLMKLLAQENIINKSSIIIYASFFKSKFIKCPKLARVVSKQNNIM